ncbi:MAG TPA: M15 family metallopeptidase [Candidatus Cryosericum sp.]|nr:M15 family metallopeptidase [Candidatus Cryosericum sp.]
MTKYKIRPGDTLGKIAKKFYGDAQRFPPIVAANRIANPDRLAVGQQLIIPDAAVAMSALAPSPADRLAVLTEERLSRVHPGLGSRGRTLVALCAQAGVAVMLTQGLRTWKEQDALYAKGRTAPPIGRKYIVTNAKGGSSWHNFGLAFDIVVLDSIGKANWDTSHPGWARAAKIGKSLGLEWGGDWKSFKDLPHFQSVGGLALADARAMFPSGLQSIWDEVNRTA